MMLWALPCQCLSCSNRPACCESIHGMQLCCCCSGHHQRLIFQEHRSVSSSIIFINFLCLFYHPSNSQGFVVPWWRKSWRLSSCCYCCFSHHVHKEFVSIRMLKHNAFLSFLHWHKTSEKRVCWYTQETKARTAQLSHDKLPYYLSVGFSWIFVI